MFFKAIDTWSKKKLTLMWLLFELLYYAFGCVAPVVTILVKYDLYKNKDQALNGVTLVAIVICGIVFLHRLKRIIDELDDTKIEQQRRKYALQCVYSLMLPIAVIFVSLAFLNNAQKAHETLCICDAFISTSICIDNLCLSFIAKERYHRHRSAEEIEMQKRISNGVV